MQRLSQDSSPPFDFWPYFDQIPENDFEGCDCSEGQVDMVWSDSNESLQHVLVKSSEENVFMVLVLDTKSKTMKGHYLLNLDDKYGFYQPDDPS